MTPAQPVVRKTTGSLSIRGAICEAPAPADMQRKPHRPISRAMGACSAPHQPTSCKSSKGTEPRGKRGSDALIGINDRTPRLLALLDTCAACRELNCAMQTLFWVEVILVGILTLAAYSRAFETLLGATIENIGKFLGVAGLAVLVVIFASQCLEWLRFGTWPAHPPVSEAFAELGIELPQTTWVGGQRIIDWFMSQAVGVVVLLLAGALGGILNALGEQIQQDALRTPRAGKAVFLIPLGFCICPPVCGHFQQ